MLVCGFSRMHACVSLLLLSPWLGRRRRFIRGHLGLSTSSSPSSLIPSVPFVLILLSGRLELRLRFHFRLRGGSRSLRRAALHEGASHNSYVALALREISETNLISASPFHPLFSARVPLQHSVKRKLHDSVDI